MTLVSSASLTETHYDVVVVGSGFGSAFFVRKLLERGFDRILMLEWGRHHPHAWQLEHDSNSAIPPSATYTSPSPKPWNFTVALGGGTNCWFAQTPRFHPSDFRLKSLYGVGNDWGITYDDLEPYYVEAEEVMSISGDEDMAAVLPRSAPFPQPPHKPSTPDAMMKAAQPDRHFVMPTARARVATQTRPGCCASLRCGLCPVDAKFTANNGLMDVFEDPRVTVVTEAEVRTLEEAGGVISGLTFTSGGRTVKVTGDLFVLGANGIQSAAIMERSGLGGGLVGRGIHESYGHEVEVFLDGVDNFDGSTITTGLNYALYDGEHRREYGAALVFFENRWKYGLRPERGRLRQILPLMLAVEDLLQDDNRVTVDGEGNAVVEWQGFSPYAIRGMERATEQLDTLLAPLPVERIEFRAERPTESHVQGTLRMGTDPATSVVDPDLFHHRIRNLVVVGSATFSSCSSANPSLTVAALSLRAADRLGRRLEGKS